MATTTVLDHARDDAHPARWRATSDLTRQHQSRMPATIRQAVLDYGVVFLRGQMITREQMARFHGAFRHALSRSDGARADRQAGRLVIDIPTLAYRAAAGQHAMLVSSSPKRRAAGRAASDRAAVDRRRHHWGDMYAAYEALSGTLRDMLDKADRGPFCGQGHAADGRRPQPALQEAVCGSIRSCGSIPKPGARRCSSRVVDREDRRAVAPVRAMPSSPCSTSM